MEINKLSILIDRLSIINVKISILEHEKRREREAEKADFYNLDLIQRKIDTLNQERAFVKNDIDRRLSEIINSGSYNPLLEERTYK